jgi:hypothetical protein
MRMERERERERGREGEREREREREHFLTFFVLKRLFLAPLRIKHFKLKRKSCNLFFLSHKYSFDRDTVPLKSSGIV